jgi:zinc/manganese transport system substrate-binding protein
MKKSLFLLLCLLSSFSPAWASALKVVAAENFYGNVAEQLGQPYVQVTSIISNPNQDPHLFSVSPRVAIFLNQANIIIENGLGYDEWMQRLYDANHTKAVLLNVSQLLKKKMGDNPHIWYDPQTMIIFSTVLVEEFIEQDPEHRAIYEKNLKRFIKNALRYKDRVEKLGQHVAGTKVTATEPVANYLLEALKLAILNKKFQQDVMNEADLTPHEIIEFEESLNNKNGARLFIYNVQVSSSITERLKNMAENNNIAIVGVSETMPATLDYYGWMNQTVDAIEKGLL